MMVKVSNGGATTLLLSEKLEVGETMILGMIPPRPDHSNHLPQVRFPLESPIETSPIKEMQETDTGWVVTTISGSLYTLTIR
jgi:hypothetical protein